MTLSPLGVRVSLVLTGLSLLHFSPRSCTSSPDFDAQDRIYCVPWCRRDKFTNRRYVDKATWRDAFDHEAFHPVDAQGSAPGVHGPSPSGGSVPRGLFLPGDKGVDRPNRQGVGRGMKLAENSWLCMCDSVIEPAHNPGDQPLLCAPWAGRTADRTDRTGGNRMRSDSAGRAGVRRRPAAHRERGGRSGTGAVRRTGSGRRPGAGVGVIITAAPRGGAEILRCPVRVTDTDPSGHRGRSSGPGGVGVRHKRHCHPGPPRACSVKRRARFARVWAVEEWRRTLGGKGLGR